ncbi:MAG: hypothetical protein AAFP80_06270 [Pseudomonadota bacterium]
MFGKFFKRASEKLVTSTSARNFSGTSLSAFRQTPQGASFLRSGGTDVYAEFNNKVLNIKGNVDAARDNPFSDQREYFQGALRVLHSGGKVSPQHPGAPLPAAPTNEPALGYSPYQKREWALAPDAPSDNEPRAKRKPERRIMGESAADVLERAGLGRQQNAPWAHIQPDHTITDAKQREDQRLRQPTFQGANQTHSAFEMAASATAKEIDGFKVSTEVGQPIGGNSGLPSGMNITFQLKSKDGSQEMQLTHFQNSFVHDGARFGDPKAIKAFVEHHKELLDSGALSAESHDKASPYMRIERLKNSEARATIATEDHHAKQPDLSLEERSERGGGRTI